MTEEELKKYHGLISDAWTVFKKYHVPQQKDSEHYDDFWKLCTQDCNTLFKRYDSSIFAHEIALDIMDEIERIEKGRIFEKYTAPPKKQLKDFTTLELLQELVRRENEK